MGMDKQKLLGKKTLTDFEARWLADRNVDHPALVGREFKDALESEEANVFGLPEGEAPELLPPYEDMSHAELKAEAAGRGLPQSGSTADLIKRLKANDEASE